MDKNGFSLYVKGANIGIFRPFKSLQAMPADKNYKTLINQLDNVSFLNSQFPTICENEIFQNLVSNSNNHLVDYYMKINILNNLILLDENDKNGDNRIISNTNITFSFYPFLNEYSLKDQEKIKIYKYEVAFLEKVGEIIDQYSQQNQLNKNDLNELFSILIKTIKKQKDLKKNIKVINWFSDLKTLILNDEYLHETYELFLNNKIYTNVNKQGSDTKNNVYYNSPVFLNEVQKQTINNIKIENFKVNLPNILETSVSSLHPITFLETDSTKINSFDLYKYINHYKQIVKIYDIDLKDSLYGFIFTNFLKIKLEKNKVIAVIKHIEKEVLMKTPWFDVGKQLSLGVWNMHSSKKDFKQRNKAIAASKEELVNSISMKRPSVRVDIIVKKYLTKYNLSSLESNEPERLMEMTDEGLKEFILGLYIKSETMNKTEES